jgi:hypothetical protein
MKSQRTSADTLIDEIVDIADNCKADKEEIQKAKLRIHARVERELCRLSLAHFAQCLARAGAGRRSEMGRALDAICQHPEALTNGEIARLFMNASAGSMKSLLTSVIWPA